MPTRYLFGSVRLSEKEKDYISEKVLKCRKLLSNYSEEELAMEVEVEQDKKGFWRVEVMIKTPHNLFRVSKNDSDLFKAVDIVEEALMKQIRRNKEKIRDLSRKKYRRENTTV